MSEFIYGDCMDAMEVMSDNMFDLAIVDPPYGVNINKSGRLGHYGGRGKKWDNAIPDKKYFDELFRVSKNQIIWGGNYFIEYLKNTKCFIIWDKKQPEGVSFASCEFAWTSFDRVAKTFYLFPVGLDNGRIVPTQKPILLYKWLLKNYAKEGDLILDTHVGSASSLIACEDMGFKYFGYELDEDYYKAASERLARHKEQGRLF